MGAFAERVAACSLMATTLLLGCTTLDSPETSALLTPPEGAKLKFCAKAIGTQNYSCTGKGSWTLLGPAAQLITEDDQRLQHYGDATGIYWESEADHSTVKLGSKTAEPHDGTIPWLLIKAERGKGTGIMSDIKYIQRLDTDGGVPPGAACKLGVDRQKIAYTAQYCFFH